jgi:hypothetical protein
MEALPMLVEEKIGSRKEVDNRFARRLDGAEGPRRTMRDSMIMN